MSNQQLLFPDAVLARLSKLYAKKRFAWVCGEPGEWPLSIGLGSPTEAQVIGQEALLSQWIAAWKFWIGAGTVQWRDRRWSRIGTQTIPERILIDSPEELAQMIGEVQNWRCIAERFAVLRERYFAGGAFDGIGAHLRSLSEIAECDFANVLRLVDWLKANPRSNLFPRQLPIKGIDSKWLETRWGLVLPFFTKCHSERSEESNFDIIGLRRLPELWRMRILDPSLTSGTGGLSDLAAPLDQLARLQLRPQRAFIVENLQSFLAFEELDRSVAILGRGYYAPALCAVPWMISGDCFYWGDIDTHGLTILSQTRSAIPHLESLLMNIDTLLSHKDLWVAEPRQTSLELHNLNDSEFELYSGLRDQRWGTNIRLEQERLPWAICRKAIERSPLNAPRLGMQL